MNKIPDIELEFDDTQNPSISSPNADFSISFYETKDTLMDVDEYKAFLNNAISRFRTSKTYKHYKDYLMNDVGLDRCQVLGNLTSETGVTLEMHHNFLTIFDIALIITESILNTKGYISTFDLVQMLKEEHKANRIPIVILSKTAHQMYHNTEGMFLPSKLCFGYWIEFLEKYKDGITSTEVAGKIKEYLTYCIENDEETNTNLNKILELRDTLEDWSVYNEYGQDVRINTVAIGSGYYNNMQYLPQYY